jgi:hypothetical protein
MTGTIHNRLRRQVEGGSFWRILHWRCRGIERLAPAKTGVCNKNFHEKGKYWPQNSFRSFPFITQDFPLFPAAIERVLARKIVE